MSIVAASSPTRTTPPPTSSRGGPFLWAARIAVLLALFDIFVIDQIPVVYYGRLQTSLLFAAGQADLGLTGELLLIVVLVLLAFAFPYLLVRRFVWFGSARNTQRNGQPPSGGQQKFAQRVESSPVATAVAATSIALIVWTLAQSALGYVTHFDSERTFKYAGALLFLLLLQSLAFTYAGFVSANGERRAALQTGALAGLICGLLTAVAWGAVDIFYGFDGDIDFTYSIVATGARLVIFAALGYLAGREGANLWLRTSAGPRSGASNAPAHPRAGNRARLSLGSFRLNGGIIWGLIGLVLLGTFFAPVSTGAYGALVTGILANSAIYLGIAAAIVVVIVGLRFLWPSLAPARRAVGTAIRYGLALGGAGDRMRSTGARRLLIVLPLLFVLFLPYLDVYLLTPVLGPGTDGRVSILADTGYYVILALGLNVVVGFAGLLDLGYVAFFVFGAYTWALFGATQFSTVVGLFSQLDHLPGIPRQLPFGIQWAWWFWPTLLLGAFVAAFFGVLLGAPTLRLRGDYLAIVTLGFGEIVPIVFRNLPRLTNGTNPVTGIPGAVVPGISFPYVETTPYYYIILALIGAVIVVNLRLRDSKLGRAWVALREDEIAVAASGVNTVRTKLLAFGTGAFFSGLAGVYHAAKLGAVSPGDFSTADSITYLAMVVLGGLGSIPGVILGASVIALLQFYVFNYINANRTDPNNVLYIFHAIDVSSVRNILFGTILVLMMLLRPEGLIPSARRKAELHGDVQAETPPPVLGALDAAIGGPAFSEEEVQLRE